MRLWGYGVISRNYHNVDAEAAKGILDILPLQLSPLMPLGYTLLITGLLEINPKPFIKIIRQVFLIEEIVQCQSSHCIEVKPVIA